MPSPPSAPASGPALRRSGPRPSPRPPPFPAPCARPGIGAAAALELAVNAVLPVALGARLWPEEAVLARYRALPAPAPTASSAPSAAGSEPAMDDPLARAAALQGALQLHARHCSRGNCGACPLS